ncbi:hypothetical protein [Streptomyces bicolor]|nr:hypothetical protein [Streptomyces bicolor]
MGLTLLFGAWPRSLLQDWSSDPRDSTDGEDDDHGRLGPRVE